MGRTRWLYTWIQRWLLVGADSLSQCRNPGRYTSCAQIWTESIQLNTGLGDFHILHPNGGFAFCPTREMRLSKYPERCVKMSPADFAWGTHILLVNKCLLVFVFPCVCWVEQLRAECWSSWLGWVKWEWGGRVTHGSACWWGLGCLEQYLHNSFCPAHLCNSSGGVSPN